MSDVVLKRGKFAGQSSAYQLPGVVGVNGST